MDTNPKVRLYTGAKRTLRGRVKKLFRPRLARATTPFDWNVDPTIINERLANMGPIRIKDQRQSSSCGGQMASYLVAIIQALKNNSPYRELSAKSYYSPVAHQGGGTTDTDIQNEIENVGGLAETMCPSNLPDGSCTEQFMTDKSWMTPPNLILASQYANLTLVTVENDIEAIAEAIRDYGAVGWHIQSEFNGGAPEYWLTMNPQLPPTTPSEGHFMCAANAQMISNWPTIRALQGWAQDYPAGWQNFTTQTYIGSKYLVDIFTFVPKYVPHPTVPGQQLPNPNLISWQRRLFQYFLALFSGAFR